MDEVGSGVSGLAAWDDTELWRSSQNVGSADYLSKGSPEIDDTELCRNDRIPRRDSFVFLTHTHTHTLSHTLSITHTEKRRHILDSTLARTKPELIVPVLDEEVILAADSYDVITCRPPDWLYRPLRPVFVFLSTVSLAVERITHRQSS